MTQWIISGTLGFIFGGIFVWFLKDSIQKKWKGAEAFAQYLRDKANRIRDAL